MHSCLVFYFVSTYSTIHPIQPLVTGPPYIRFYAGAPLRTAEGYNVGSLCIVDDKPRTECTPRTRHTLKEFASTIMREMSLWRDKVQLRTRDRIQVSVRLDSLEMINVISPTHSRMDPWHCRT